MARGHTKKNRQFLAWIFRKLTAVSGRLSLTPSFSWVLVLKTQKGTVSTVSAKSRKPLKRLQAHTRPPTPLKRGVNRSRPLILRVDPRRAKHFVPLKRGVNEIASLRKPLCEASRLGRCTTLVLFVLVSVPSVSFSQATSARYGLESRPVTKPFLLMPDRADGEMPSRLSQTGAFLNTRDLAPNAALIPYEINVSFWADGAHKTRWIAVPKGPSASAEKITFSPTGEWTFPKGTVFVKHFELATDETHPEIRRRLETRLLICDSTGSVYGVTYKWRPDNSDADLLATNLNEAIPIKTVSGLRTQTWYYPSRQDCRTCHTDLAGGVLGVKTRQLNCEFSYPSGVKDNQLRAWNHAGLFQPALAEADIGTMTSLAKPSEMKRTLEDRARSYLDANCTHCHRPGGTVATFDTRYDVPLPRQNLIGTPVLIDQGVDGARAIAPNDPWRSIVLMRLNSVEALKMPPLAHQVVDEQGVALVRDWIKSLPGPPVLDPPLISPRGGHFEQTASVTLRHPEPGAVIHYTLDGSAPTVSDPVYEHPIKLEGAAVVRARAYKAGFTRSIAVQEVFVPEE